MAGFLNVGPIVANESEDSDIFTFLDIPLNDVDVSQRSSQSRSSYSSGQGPQSILKKTPSYTSLTSLQSGSILKKTPSYTSLTSLRSGSISSNTGRSIRVEEPETDSFQASTGMKRVSSNVSFQTVNVREYDRTLGDNPSCMSGPPISLDWSYSKTTALPIDEYETNRTPRRNSQPLRMNKFKREKMLKSKLGYSEEEIENAKKEKKKVQRSRSVTQFVSPFWRIEHACQSVKRKLGRRSNKDNTDDLSGSKRSGISTSSVTKSIDSSLGTMTI